MKLDFQILADADAAVCKSYGLVHPGGGPKGQDIAIPATLLIDRDGRVVWRRVSRLVSDRPDPLEIVDAIGKMP